MSIKTNETTALALGDTVASIIAPGERYGRVTRLIKKGRRDRRIVVREFEPGDTWFPTGKEYYKRADVITQWSAGSEGA